MLSAFKIIKNIRIQSYFIIFSLINLEYNLAPTSEQILLFEILSLGNSRALNEYRQEIAPLVALFQEFGR